MFSRSIQYVTYHISNLSHQPRECSRSNIHIPWRPQNICDGGILASEYDVAWPASAATSTPTAATPTTTAATAAVMRGFLLLTLSGARHRLVLVGASAASHGAIDELAAARGLADSTAERVAAAPRGLTEPTAQASVADHGALATVLVFAAVNRAVEFVDQVQEATEVARREVVAHALENIKDLVVGDLAVVVPVGLLVKRLQGLHHGHSRFSGDAARRLRLQETAEKSTATNHRRTSVSEVAATAGAKVATGSGCSRAAGAWPFVHASQWGALGGTIDRVNRFLSQHGGNLVPHGVAHLFLRSCGSFEFLDQVVHHADLVLVQRSLG